MKRKIVSDYNYRSVERVRVIREKLLTDYNCYPLDYDINIEIPSFNLSELSVYRIILYKVNVFRIRKKRSLYLPCIFYNKFKIEIKEAVHHE